LPTSYLGSAWEQAFLKRNGKVRVYQPDTKINQAWQQYSSLYPERITVLTPSQARFESDRLIEGSARFMSAMSIFSDPAFFRHSHYDQAKRENIFVLTSEGESLISAAAKVLANGGYFIYGWFHLLSQKEQAANSTSMRLSVLCKVMSLSNGN
jgi:hypothetical protein